MIGRMAAFVLLLAGLACLGLTTTGRLYIVRTNSMAPALQAGDAIVLRPPGQMPAVGDIVTYEKSGKVITHRVVEIRDGAAIVKGDANEGPDPWSVRPSEIRGIAAARIPYLGYFLAFLRQPGGWFLFVVLPAALILYNEAGRARRLYQEWRREGTAVG